MQKTVDEIMATFPEMNRLSIETEAMRGEVDKAYGTANALKVMIDIDTNMLVLMDYHVRLSTALLRLTDYCYGAEK